MTDENKIDGFLKEAPLFLQSWWLEAVAPGRWDYAVANRGDEIAAVLPYVKARSLTDGTCAGMPPLTQFLGPWLRPSSAKYAKQLAEQKDLMTELIGELPAGAAFNQGFHHSITNWLPFYWQGFTQTTRYTYRIDDLSDENRIWDGLAGNIRSDIRKARKTVAVTAGPDIDRFLNMNEKTFRRQERGLPYSRELVRRMDAACAQRDCRCMFFAEDEQGRDHAAVYLVWDADSAYYLMGGGDPTLRNSGASSLLLWEAIRHSAGVTRSFDFEGSVMEPVERFCRAFGARQVPYFQVRRTRMDRLKAGLKPYLSRLASKIIK